MNFKSMLPNFNEFVAVCLASYWYGSQ